MTAVVMAGGLVLADGFSGFSSDASAKENQGNNRHYKKELMLSEKEFIEPELVLIDARNGAELQKLKASSLKTTKDAEKITEELEAKYDRPMIPAKLGSDGKLKPGQSRIVLEKDKLKKELQNVTAFQRVIEVPITETAPNVTAETAANVNQALLASYTTKFDPSVKGRTTNIALSAQVIDQIVLGPGDRFYYNLIIGDTTVEKGYQEALEIVNKEFVIGIGGGICQTSSTLFNAIDKAGLGILERNTHSKQVGYVPIGRDATVSYGGKDFKFLNNKDFPVMIKTIVNKQKGTLEVQVRTAAKYVGK